MIVLDNHSSHTAHDTAEVFKSKGSILLFLPPYSSYLNPVERIWGWIKIKWRAYIMSMPESDYIDREREIN